MPCFVVITITPLAAWFKNLGGVAFGFMLPVLAGFIAMAVGDRPALALGFVGGMIAANGKSGFLGALVAGFAAGYIIILLRKVCDNLPEFLEKIAPVLIYPLVGILLMGLLMAFVVEPVMGGINTALNNGFVSATISFLRTLVFQVAAIIILPLLFGINGIWFAVVIAEILALIVSIAFLICNRKKYKYA